MTQAKSGDEASLEQLSMQLQALEDKVNRYVVPDDPANAGKVAQATGCSGCYTGPCFSPACTCNVCHQAHCVHCVVCQPHCAPCTPCTPCTQCVPPACHPAGPCHACASMVYGGPGGTHPAADPETQ